jgi:hypothetical protein
MTAHLTHEELTDRLLGAQSATVDVHLLDCAACSKELDQLRNSIGLFRGAVRGWSEVEHSRREEAHSRILPAPRSFDWLLVGAVTMILSMFAILYIVDRADTKQQVQFTPPTSVNPIEKDSEAQIKQDNELLSQINQELSEGLPAPMQPLEVSVSQRSTSSSSNQD